MDVVRGDVVLELNDKATPELRRVEAEYRAALARIDAMEAEAKIGADTSELDAALKQARDRVRILDGQLHAEAEIGADTSELQKELTIARAEVKQLDGLKAEIEIETRGERQALANIAKVRAAEAQRAAAQQRYMANAEKAAYRENEVRRRSSLNAARDEAQMIRLAQKWSKLTDEVEKADRAIKRMPFRTEKRVQLEVDRARAMADMELVKKEMEFRGGHPPVKIRVDTDSQRAEAGMGRIKRALFGLRDSAARGGGRIFDALGNVGALRVLGNRLSTLVKVASVLSPVLVSVAGAATGLVGVLGTGLAGAAAIGAGALGGMILNMGGVVAAIHPMISDFKIAHQATQAYSKAVLKYGASSKQAKTAQDQMNHALAGVSPQAADAARNMTKLSTEWQKLTGKTARTDVGMVMNQVMKTMHTAMPAMAKNTNQTMNIITGGISHMMASIRQNTRSDGKGGIIGSLGRSFNNFLGPAMRGAEHLGAAIARIAESAARLFAGPAGHGFERWAAHFDKSTQNSDKLDATIKRLGNHATDLLHFFGALGRLLMTVFNGGADSGDRMVKSMTHALNRWNKFLQSPRGQTSMADFFKRAEGGARALWGALGPLIGAFVQWSSLLAPFTSGLLKGVGFVSKLVAGFTKLVGMKGSLGALGATIGVMFAVSKVAGFIGMLGRVVGLLRTAGRLARAGRIADAFKSLGNIGGSLSGKGAGIAGQIESAGTAAGREMATQIEAAGTAAAGEIRTAMQTGGTTAASEIGAAETAGGTAAASEIGAAETAGGTAAASEIETAMAAGGATAAGEIGAAEAAGGAGLLGGLGKGGLLRGLGRGLFRFGGPIVAAHFIARDLFHNSEMDPLAFLSPDKAGGAGDMQKGWKKRQDAWVKGFGSEASHKAAMEWEKNLGSAFVSLGRKGGNVFSRITDNWKGRQRMEDTFAAIEKTMKGRRFIATLAIKTKGDKEAQKTIAHLAASKLGSKFLQIISRGGPEAATWLARISKTSVGNKLLKIITQGGPGAHKLVTQLSDKKIRDKVFKIIQHGGPDVQKKLDKLLGTHIRDKSFKVAVHDAASAVLHGIHAAIGGLHSKTVTVTTVFRQVGKAIGNAAGALYSTFHARGGPAWAWDDVQDPILRDKQERAANAAMTRGAQPTRGGKYNRPTLLVGEEDRDEYVIATNPAYRRTNIKYLAQAAADLGVMVVTGAAKGGSYNASYPFLPAGSYINPNRTAGGQRNPFRGIHHADPFRGIANMSDALHGLPGYSGTDIPRQLNAGTLGPNLAGTFSLEDLDKYRDDVHTLLTTQQRAYDTHAAAASHWFKVEDQARIRYLNTPDKNRGPKKKYANQMKAATKKYQYNWYFAHAARVGGTVRDGKKTYNFKSLATMTKLRRDIDAEDKALHNWHDDRDHLISEGTTAFNKADQAKTRYENSGNPNDLTEYHRLMKIHDEDYVKVEQMDSDAYERASRLFEKLDIKSLRTLMDSLNEDLTTAQGELLNIDDLTTDPAFAGLAAPTLDQYLGTHGATQPGYNTLAEQRAALELAYSKSRGDDTSDPTTHLVNETTSKSVMDFYQSVMDQLDRENAPAALQTEASEAFNAARETYLGEQVAAHPAADLSTSVGLQQAQADTYRQDVLSRYGGNVAGLAGLDPTHDPSGRGMGSTVLNPAFLAPDYGDIGGPASLNISTRGSGLNAGAGGGSVHVTNNFGAPPPDPHTWSQGVKFEIGALL